jgi:hypothetical protein
VDRYFGTTLSSGLPKANSIARPTPMMQEHLRLQRGSELGLTRRGLEKAAAHDPDADARAGSAEPDHEADTDPGISLDHRQHLKFFHFGFLSERNHGNDENQ